MVAIARMVFRPAHLVRPGSACNLFHVPRPGLGNAGCGVGGGGPRPLQCESLTGTPKMILTARPSKEHGTRLTEPLLYARCQDGLSAW